MNEGKDYGMGESIVPSAHHREANTSQQNKNPQRTAGRSNRFENRERNFRGLCAMRLPYKSGQPARLFASFLKLFSSLTCQGVENQEKSSLLGKKVSKSFVHG